MPSFDKLVSFVSSQLACSSATIQGPDVIPLDKSLFRSLAPAPSEIVFVDGGNAELLSGPNVSVQFVRLYTGWCVDNKCTRRLIDEFFMTVVLKETRFEVALLALDGRLLYSWSINAFEPGLCVGGRMAQASAVANYIRTVLEFEHLAQAAAKGVILVRDGDLEAQGEPLVRAKELLLHNAQGPVLGLAKTSLLCTNSGDSALGALRKIAPQGAWWYDGSNTCSVKLHPKSKYIFRCDVKGSPQDTFAALAANSVDPAFLGYPYGLVEADKFAQVTHEERAQLRLRFAMESKGEFADILLTTNAHDVLNSL
jgi:hypothetical protein